MKLNKLSGQSWKVGQLLVAFAISDTRKTPFWVLWNKFGGFQVISVDWIPITKIPSSTFPIREPIRTDFSKRNQHSQQLTNENQGVLISMFPVQAFYLDQGNKFIELIATVPSLLPIPWKLHYPKHLIHFKFNFKQLLRFKLISRISISGHVVGDMVSKR